MDDHRALTSRREAELTESQIKLEKHASEAEKLQNELASYKREQDLLHAKLVDTTSKLTSAEEKLKFFEGRALNRQFSTTATAEEQARDVELALAQTRIELDAAVSSLALQKDEVEQYKSISQASEERLMEVNSTYDIYKAEVEKQVSNLMAEIATKTEEIAELKESVASAIAEVTDTQQRLDAVKVEAAANARSLESQISSLQESEARAFEEKAISLQDVELHANIANEAQANYQREVVAHSSALQQLTNMKAANAEKAEALENACALASSATERLENSSASSKVIQEKLEQQISELETRVGDLRTQNTLLHSQFEQVVRSQKLDFSEAQGPEGIANAQHQELAEVIKFLRREKDIVETQLTLSLQETERSRAQIRHMQKSHDETRLLLEDERKRYDQSTGSEVKHKELMERIEQANLLRESNVTLRSQMEAFQTKLSETERKLAISEAEINPLKATVAELKGEIEIRKAECVALEEDNQRWKGRTQQILQKYERIDPLEHKKLIEDVAAMQEEKLALIAQIEKSTIESELLIKEKDQKLQKVNEVGRKYKILAENRARLIAERDSSISEKDAKILSLSDLSNQKEFIAIREERERLVAAREAQTTNFNRLLLKAKGRIHELESALAEKPKDVFNKAASDAERQKLIVAHQNEIKAARAETEKAYQSKINILQTQLVKTRSDSARLISQVKDLEKLNESTQLTDTVVAATTVIAQEASAIQASIVPKSPKAFAVESGSPEPTDANFGFAKRTRDDEPNFSAPALGDEPRKTTKKIKMSPEYEVEVADVLQIEEQPVDVESANEYTDDMDEEAESMADENDQPETIGNDAFRKQLETDPNNFVTDDDAGSDEFEEYAIS